MSETRINSVLEQRRQAQQGPGQTPNQLRAVEDPIRADQAEFRRDQSRADTRDMTRSDMADFRREQNVSELQAQVLARQQAEQLAIAQGADSAGMQAIRAAGIDMGSGRQFAQQSLINSADEFAQGPLRAAGTGSEAFDFQALIKSKVVTNALDQYANYTYHIKFWMTSDSQAEKLAETTNKDDIDNIPKVVIAESGVTVGFNISEFTYRNLTGTTKETRNMPSISWSMKITEPYGFSLPDRLSTASREIGVLNWQRGKYFIQLWFTGYNEQGQPVSQALFHQVFRVSITNIDFNGNEGGGNYHIKGLFDGMAAFTNQLSLSEKNINVSATTVGEMLQKFESALNNNAIDLAYGTAPLEEYRIKFPNEMTQWSINKNRLSDDARSRNMNIKAEGNTITVNANPGVDFSNMVNRILSLTDEFLRWSQGGEGQNNSIGTLSHGLVRNIKIHARVEHVGYDTLAKDYVKRITYTIVPYYEVRVRGEDIPTIRNTEKKNVQQDKLRFLFSANRIRKKYEWIYTGQNLDIIKFEFKVNNFFVIATVPFSGANFVSNHTQGPVSGEDNSAWQARQGRYRNAKVKYDRLSNEVVAAEKDLVEAKKVADKTLEISQRTPQARTVQDQVARADISNQLDNAFQRSAQAEQRLANLRGNLQQARQEREAARRDFVDFYQQGPAGIVSNNPLAQQRLAQEADFLNRYNQAVKQGQRDLFVEDQDVKDIPDAPPFINTVRPDQEACVADFNQGASSRQTPGNATNKINYPRSRTAFGAVVGNLDSVNKEMINIELEIRGDPFWLGHSNIDVNSQVPSNLSKLSSDYAEYLGGDNLYYLSFRSGQAPNEQTGFMQFTSNNQFVDGFYSVIEVKNTFSNGRFTQVLKSFKDTFSNTGNSEMDKFIKEAEINQQLRSTASTATPAIRPPSPLAQQQIQARRTQDAANANRPEAQE
jgi:hypothetical protein